jgi:glycosyltransferase involved in cell wall biosynthesis
MCVVNRILFVVNVGWFFVSHRLPIAIAAKHAGYEVHVATALDPEQDQNTPQLFAAHGLILHRLQLSRSGAHPLELIKSFRELVRLYRQLDPHLIHLVTLKPVLLGGIAARLLGRRGVILAVPGRGSVFSAKGLLATVRRWVAVLLYKLAYVKNRAKVIIQNEEDKAYFVKRRVFAEQDIRLIRGSGADIERFKVSPEPNGTPVVVLASRMLKEKGIADFVAAARALKASGVVARFVLVGDPDQGNPHSHTRSELEAWARSGAVEWWGFRADMHTVFAQAHVVCLPTFYGEGVPKVLIEAAASGRAIVTTNMPGCRDIVRHGENGLLVEPRDVAGLAEAIRRLLTDVDLRVAMGLHGRKLVESEFSVNHVVQATLQLYCELMQ